MFRFSNEVITQCRLGVNCNLILQAVTFLISCLTPAYAHCHRARRKMHHKPSSGAVNLGACWSPSCQDGAGFCHVSSSAAIM